MARAVLKFGKGSWLAAALAIAAAGQAQAQDGNYSPDIASFDGAKSMAIDPSPTLRVGEEATIEFWVAPGWAEDPGYDPVVVSNISNERSSYIIAILRDRDGVGVLSGDVETVAPFDFDDGKLHHVAVVHSDNGLVILVDGVLRGVSKTGLAANSVEAFWVGSIDGSLNPFTGEIGQLRIWNAALEPETLEAFKLQSAFADGDKVHPRIGSLIAVSVFPEAGLLLVEDERNTNFGRDQ